MTGGFRPGSIDEIAETVAWAVSAKAPLDVQGTGTKRGIGRAMQTQATVDLSQLNGITLYEPEELVMTAKAGTLLAEAEAALEKRGQEFQFEPPDLSGLLGSRHAGTLGGMISGNLSGPRRIKSGAARDHFLGFTGVSGRGEIFKSGSRVMKNVTGYDLPKLMAGSWGTLAILDDVTFKVLPAAETRTTLAVCDLDVTVAARAMAEAMGSSCEVSGAAHLPADIAPNSSVQAVAGAGGAVTLLRLEGIGPSVEFRADKLEKLMKAHGRVFRLDAAATVELWREIRDVAFLAHERERLVWRISVPPMEGPAVLAAIGNATDARGYLDWAGGLIWLSVPPSDHASAQLVRGAFASTSGHATLIRAPESIRASLAVFDPPPGPLLGLSRRIKDAFDPLGILNPGRIHP